MIFFQDHIESDYLTQPLEENIKMSLIDCFVLGLLKLKKVSNLKTIDFTRFEKGKPNDIYNQVLKHAPFACYHGSKSYMKRR